MHVEGGWRLLTHKPVAYCKLTLLMRAWRACRHDRKLNTKIDNKVASQNYTENVLGPALAGEESCTTAQL